MRDMNQMLVFVMAPIFVTNPEHMREIALANTETSGLADNLTRLLEKMKQQEPLVRCTHCGHYAMTHFGLGCCAEGCHCELDYWDALLSGEAEGIPQYNISLLRFEAA